MSTFPTASDLRIRLGKEPVITIDPKDEFALRQAINYDVDHNFTNSRFYYEGYNIYKYYSYDGSSTVFFQTPMSLIIDFLKSKGYRIQHFNDDVIIHWD